MLCEKIQQGLSAWVIVNFSILAFFLSSCESGPLPELGESLWLTIKQGRSESVFMFSSYTQRKEFCFLELIAGVRESLLSITLQPCKRRILISMTSFQQNGRKNHKSKEVSQIMFAFKDVSDVPNLLNFNPDFSNWGAVSHTILF